MEKFGRSFLVVILLVTVGVFAGIIFSSDLEWMQRGLAVERAKETKLGSTEKISADMSVLEKINENSRAIARDVVPVVVSISSKKVVKLGDESSSENWPFKDFFGEDFFKHFQVPREQVQRGLGSGVIVSKEGYILTNNHVVDGADELKVTLSDKREFEAKVVGRDPLTDIAVVKVESKDLPVARLGDSDDMQVGDIVYAVGNPLGLTSTVTQGIVSALGRKVGVIKDSFGIENFIQTDAVINPGNSGGPLVNIKGEVIGINTAIATRSWRYEGYGFAAPVNLARKIMRDLIDKGKVVRAFLGIAMSDINEDMARALGLEKPKGILVQEIIGKPARESGIKPGDVIIEIDGQKINRANQVQTMIAKKSPGDKISVGLIREGKDKKIEVTLGEKEAEEIRVVSSEHSEFQDLGISVQPLTKEFAEGVGYEGDGGVVISQVKRHSPAFEAGIIEGDIVLKVNSESTKSVKDFKAKVSDAKGGSVVLFFIWREGHTSFAAVKVPK